MKTLKIKISLLSDSAQVPEYSTAHSSGMDLTAAIKKAIKIKPGRINLVPTGLALEIPPGYEGQVRPRSGLAVKYGISVVNAPGTIDADYRGEVGVILINLGKKDFIIRPGDRIAQLVISPVVKAKLVKTKSLNSTARGQGGFGHTGVGKRK
ncbi:MAG: dUTP diphosphatase [Candidatus Edwardsbacteria bacterium]|nr:dUTP diphosphatase [Candidatus Edwardsbacteria bacterium]MBU1576834.1 dUTP diphosphatase [Candidatus Edwardsbacteria bacterium]MBU2463825.1 dUTP diphosphatase [Candidatus Edwardsbacteria bacterium]MBU2593397.1 dUTP diphosphatase [Candidatus Edwardsbacteria bacterium]